MTNTLLVIAILLCVVNVGCNAYDFLKNRKKNKKSEEEKEEK